MIENFSFDVVSGISPARLGYVGHTQSSARIIDTLIALGKTPMQAGQILNDLRDGTIRYYRIEVTFGFLELVLVLTYFADNRNVK